VNALNIRLGDMLAWDQPGPGSMKEFWRPRFSRLLSNEFRCSSSARGRCRQEADMHRELRHYRRPPCAAGPRSVTPHWGKLTGLGRRLPDTERKVTADDSQLTDGSSELTRGPGS